MGPLKCTVQWDRETLLLDAATTSWPVVVGHGSLLYFSYLWMHMYVFCSDLSLAHVLQHHLTRVRNDEKRPESVKSLQKVPTYRYHAPTFMTSTVKSSLGRRTRTPVRGRIGCN
ncbi:hypothetical protein MHYP_G00132510 [Metynnis hypsauchen]